MTPTGFFLQHREMVIELAAHNTLSETWRLLAQQTDIESVMSENTLKGLLTPFLETSRFYADELNKKLHNQQELHNEQELNKRLHEQIKELHEKLHNEQELNEKLHNQLGELHEEQELNEKLNNDERLNEKLNEAEQLNKKLKIAGWTVGKCGEYYRAVRKISGKVHGIHLGRHLDLIDAKTRLISSQSNYFWQAYQHQPRHLNVAPESLQRATM
jgi:DNA repair exonuclease SbcCD ATPase subunit